VSDDILGQLTGAAPRELLEDLARIGRALAKAERVRPEIELFLASGQNVRGRIVGVGEDRAGPIAIVQIGGTAKQPSVTFVRIDQVAAMTVVDASLLVQAPALDAPVPGKLELQRQVAMRAQGLVTTLGRPFAIELVSSDLDDDGRRAISVALPILAEVLSAIAADDLGKEAIASIEGIELGAAASADIQRSGKHLAVRAPKLVTEQLTHAVLRRAIEKLL
jgi:hypothetical protein